MFLLYFIYFGGELISFEVECFFMYLDILILIMVFLLLKMDLVSVCVSFVLLIFVGFKKMNELIGCLGFFNFVFVCLIVFVIVIIVLFWLMIWEWRMFFILRSLFVLVWVILDIGILV